MKYEVTQRWVLSGEAFHVSRTSRGVRITQEMYIPYTQWASFHASRHFQQPDRITYVILYLWNEFRWAHYPLGNRYIVTDHQVPQIQ